MKYLRNILILAVSTLFTQEVICQTLNNVQLFARCYSQLTQMTVTANHPQMLAVRDNGKDPVTACMEIFDRTLFTVNNNTRIEDINDEEAVAVLRTMHKFHTTWFDVKDSPGAGSGAATQGTQDMLDGEAPALHLTRALFKPGTEYKTILTGRSSLKALREFMDPDRGANSNGLKADNIFRATTPHTGVGELRGIRGVGASELIRSYSFQQNTALPPVTGTVNLGTHFGGGLLGEQIYLLQNIGQVRDFVANGAEKMPRKLARGIYNDMLCRTLPVIRTEDAVPFVVPESPVAFRVSSGCVRCHASMDRTSAVARNFIYNLKTGLAADGNRGFELVEPQTVNKPEEATWPTAPDRSYSRRPSNGVLYFRNYRGQLVNENVNSLASLGAAIVDQDDFYACAAKRYYNYFIGVDVDIGDINDPAAGIWLTDKDTFHRNKVLQLGTGLKTSQSTRALIEAIFRLPSYRRSDFGFRLP